jgi:hypothetical protein
MKGLNKDLFSRDKLKNCLECGYSLFGSRSGRCSECGHPIDLKVDLSLPLERSPPRIISSFAKRMTLITLLLGVVTPVVMILFGRSSDGSSVFAMMCVPLILSSWLITTPWRDPIAISNGFGPHDSVLQATRWGSFCWLLLAAGSFFLASGFMAGTLIPEFLLEILWGLVFLVCLFQVFLLFVCFEKLAHWMRDEFACTLIRFIHLSLIVIGIGVLVGIIGPILFPISPGLFPCYSVVVFCAMMIMTIILLVSMSRSAWFSLAHSAENLAADRRDRDRFAEEVPTNGDSETRL